MNDLGIVGGEIFDGFRSYKANLYIKGGRISAITSDDLETKEWYNANGMYVLPGLIDPHVHFALSLGQYRSADDFESGSIGAAFGGITTYIDFLDPVTHEKEIDDNFAKRMGEAKGSHVDFSFHMTIAHPDFTADKLEEKTLKLGMNSIKVFTTYSSSNRMTDDGYILDLLSFSKKRGVVIDFHAENDPIIVHRSNIKKKHLPDDLPFLHPYESEIEAVSRISTFAKITGGQAYIVHNSSGRSVELLKRSGIPKNLKLETCPQYLTLDESFYDGELAPLYTLVPPLRSKVDLEMMRALFVSGAFSTVGTDHCPFKKNEKLENENDYDRMPNGIGGVETSFAILYTNFVEKSLIDLNDLVKVQSVNVAEIFGLKNKGKIEVGADGDIAIFDPNFEWTVNSHDLHTKTDYTPYEGMKLKGKFASTIVRGEFVVKDGEFIGGEGKFVKRGRIFWRTR